MSEGPHPRSGLFLGSGAGHERRMLKWSFVVLILLLSALAFVLFRSLQRYHKANEAVQRANVVLIELQNVLFNLKDAELGCRGYILTHDTAYLAPFVLAQANIRSGIKRLDASVVDHLDRTRVDSLNTLTADLFRRLHDQLLLERGSLPGLQGLERVRMDEARAVMERIRGNRLRMVAELEDLRGHYSPLVSRNSWLTPVMLWVSFAVALAALALLLWRLLKALATAEAAEGEVRRKMEELDQEVRTREFAERSLRRVLDSSASGIFAFRSKRDGKGAIADLECLFANRVGMRMFLLPAADGMARGASMHTVPGMAELFPVLVDVVETGKELAEEREGTLPNVDWIGVHAVRLLDGVVLTVTDLSEQRAQRQEAMETDRLAVTGRIARTVAHEVRNPLTNLRLALEQWVEELAEEGSVAPGPYVGILQRNIGRIDQLITDLLESSKPKEVQVLPTRVDQVLGTALASVADRLALRGMVGRVDVAPDLPLVMLDPAMMQVALTNICINAVEAMEADAGNMELVGVPLPGGGVGLGVRDNGKGIPPEDIQRLFEAFFSGRRGGMGLGLTSARSIINAHGATLSVDSTVGEGTFFLVRFPASACVPDPKG